MSAEDRHQRLGLSEGDLDSYVFQAIKAGPGPDEPAMTLVRILERVDAAQKILLDYEDLGGALGRLQTAGRVRETGPGTYRVESQPRPDPHPEPLDQGLYNAAVEAYDDEFAGNVVDLWKSPALRSMIDEQREAYRASSGLSGLAPDWFDLEATAIAFTLGRVAARFGGAIDPMGQRQHPLELTVNGITDSDQRGAVTLAARQALQENELTEREVWLRFDTALRIRVLP